GNIMKQAQQMQANMGEMQAKMAEIEVTGASGGGMLRVVVNGKGDLRKVTIDKSLVDPEDVEVLEDLIVAAFNDAKGKADAAMQDEMAKLTGGLNIPGLKLPF
ncbi:MAG: YbaB/EbfC family nucleoid-associated protein, partial [Alphaproteobacteria bacterium]|nr:YbaB/EbfC family nucleoid-associated protein [Alphaproteobacteria bacterium]